MQPDRTLGTLALVARGRCCSEKTKVLGPIEFASSEPLPLLSLRQFQCVASLAVVADLTDPCEDDLGNGVEERRRRTGCDGGDGMV